MKLLFLILSAGLMGSGIAWAGNPSAADFLSDWKTLEIRVVPRNLDSASGTGIKTVTAERNTEGIRLKWYSPLRVQVDDPKWPIYKVIMKKGALWTNGLGSVSGMAHPALWVSGLVSLSDNGLLWAPPSFFDTNKILFEPGFLGSSFFSFSKGPVTLVKSVGEFRNMASMDPDFAKKFSEVRIEKNQDWPLVVDGKKTEVPVVVLANDFVRYVVLKSRGNPLILSLTFSSSRAPSPLKGFLDFFHENMEYQVTQINVGRQQSLDSNHSSDNEGGHE